MRRLVALGALIGALSLAAWLASLAVNRVAADAPPPPPTDERGPAAAEAAADRLPGGLHRAGDGRSRRGCASDRREKRKVDPLIRQQQYLALTERSGLPGEFAGDRKARNLEGFLFPATYDFTAKTTTRQLVEKQLTAFRKAWKQVDMATRGRRTSRRTTCSVIASMVEEETIAPDERPLVAAVIYNRLKAGMPLGIDATIRYGLDVAGDGAAAPVPPRERQPVQHAEPAGAAADADREPGLASIQAAAHPADVDYLFFVRKPDKVHHFFTADESQFYAEGLRVRLRLLTGPRRIGANWHEVEVSNT